MHKKCQEEMFPLWETKLSCLSLDFFSMLDFFASWMNMIIDHKTSWNTQYQLFFELVILERQEKGCMLASKLTTQNVLKINENKQNVLGQRKEH